MRFLRLLAPSASQVRSSPRGPTRGRLPPSGFCNLSAASSLLTLRAYFIPLAPAGFPLQGLYSRGAVSPFSDLLPSCRYRRPASRCQATELQLVFRALLSSRPPPLSATRLSETGRGTLLGSWLSRVFLLSAVGRLSAPLPSRAWTRAVRDVAASTPQGISEPRELLISRETASPLELLDLFELPIHLRAPPDLAHFFTSGPTSRCHKAVDPLRSVLAPYRS